jgi:2,4-dienoyl-CoA reductase-like NADH-dependent reductase (Old Yellow Enzyme family)
MRAQQFAGRTALRRQLFESGNH